MAGTRSAEKCMKYQTNAPGYSRNGLASKLLRRNKEFSRRGGRLT
jgi:hypothetical protein